METKTELIEALAAFNKRRIAKEVPNAQFLPSEEHHTQWATEIAEGITPYVNALKAKADLIPELVATLRLCDRAFKAGKLKDISIVPVYDENATKVELVALSDIVADALTKANKLTNGD